MLRFLIKMQSYKNLFDYARYDKIVTIKAIVTIKTIEAIEAIVAIETIVAIEKL